MRKVFTLTLLIAMFMIGSMLQAQTTIPGATINSDTTWTLDSSPISITDKVYIQSGATLTIESGMYIDFGTELIELGVFVLQGGTLIADGITFDGTQVASANTWAAIEIQDNGSLLLSNSNLSGHWTPPSNGGTDWRGVHITGNNADTVIINGCSFSGFNNAISLARQSDIEVTNSFFAFCNTGISLQYGTAMAIDCLFEEIEETCIKVAGGPQFVGNVANIQNCIYTASPNAIGVSVDDDAQASIMTSCFSQLSVGIENTSSNQVLAEDNWWSNTSGPNHTLNPAGTGLLISGDVDYQPWSTNSCANFSWTDWVSDGTNIEIFEPSYNSTMINNRPPTLERYCYELGVNYISVEQEYYGGSTSDDSYGYNYGSWEVHPCFYDDWHWDDCDGIPIILNGTSNPWIVLPQDMITKPCDNECIELPFTIFTTVPLEGFQVPLTYLPPYKICSISTVGLITDGWTSIYNSIDNTTGILSVSMAQGAGAELPIGVDTLFYIYFYAPPQCNTDSYYLFDTTYSGDPFKQLAFVDSSGAVILPSFVSDTVTIEGYVPGDIDLTGLVDIGDLVAYVDFAFGSGPNFCIANAADVNGTGSLDIADIVHLVNYMFGGGPAPVCGAIGTLKSAKYIANANIRVDCIYDGSKTKISLNSAYDIRGLELYLDGDDIKNIDNLQSQLDLLHRYENGSIKVGMLDLDGTNVISKGKQIIFEIEGEYQLQSAIIVDDQMNVYSPVLNQLAKEIPTDFSLAQNYPNPFNPTTTISFGLPEASDVKINVYNINGQKVTQLLSGQMEAGVHSVEWDGRELASGVYFYRLEAGTFTETKKMILMK